MFEERVRHTLLFAALLTFGPFWLKGCTAQTGGVNETYLWQHKIAVTTTAIDSTTTKVWQDVTVFFFGVDGEIKFATQRDTTNFNSRPYVPLENGQPFRIGPQSKLYRWKFRSQSGSGYFIMVGTKLGKMFP